MEKPGFDEAQLWTADQKVEAACQRYDELIGNPGFDSLGQAAKAEEISDLFEGAVSFEDAQLAIYAREGCCPS